VHKVHIHIQRKWLRDNSASLEQIDLLQPVAHLTVSGALAGTLHEMAALGFSQRSSTKNHQTVRCAIGLSGEPTKQRSTLPMVNCAAVWLSEVIRQSAMSDRTRLSDVPPDYPMHQKDWSLQQSTTSNPNGRLTWHSPDSEQWSVRCTTGLSGVPNGRAVSQRLE
jgi:hypothetical protein